LRGGAIAVQLFAAFYAQSYSRVLPHLRVVFFFRFFSWFMIGFAIYAIGDSNKTLTLWLIGVGLFFFSFSAGFGGIYFKEIIAKVFTREQRGRTMADKQLFSSLAAILSGGVTGVILENFEAPMSYAYLFMVSAFLMLIGLFAFATIDEPIKKNTSEKEASFGLFIQNAVALFRNDQRLRLQVAVSLLGYSYLFSLPFIILKAKESFELTGWLLGGFVTIQMVGSMLGNLLLWKRFGGDYIRMIRTAYLLIIASIIIAFFADNPYTYGAIFLLFGIAVDGFRNADMNLILEIAPEAKRPVYVAIHSTLTSVGIFFSIPGGFILQSFGYSALYFLTFAMLLLGLIVTKRLKDLGV
jgi:MFS family permease